MTNVPASVGVTLSVVVFAIIFGIIAFATITFLYYRKKWAAEKEKGEGKREQEGPDSSVQLRMPTRTEVPAAASQPVFKLFSWQIQEYAFEANHLDFS